MTIAKLPGAALIACALLTATAQAAEQSAAITAKSRAEALAVFNDYLAADKKGVTGLKLAHLLYADNAVIVGEGRRTLTGFAGAVKTEDDFLTHVLGPGASCGPLTIDEPIVATATTLSAFQHATCQTPSHKDRPVIHSRMIYVWARLPQGWRCVLEYWGLEPA